MFKPLLASEANLETLQFPVVASPKLDGVRAIVTHGKVFSRSLKPIPNSFVQEQFSHLEFFDGELIVGLPTDKNCYRNTVSAVMSRDKRDINVKFYAFDYIESLSKDFITRHSTLRHQVEMLSREKSQENVILLEQRIVLNMPTLLLYERWVLAQGFEGLILRKPDSIYKTGRSTTLEGTMLKLKRFTDGEFELVGFEERKHNSNPAFFNELGLTARSSCQGWKVGRDDLGALILRWSLHQTFNCGTGFTDQERQEIWDNQERYVGLMVKVKFMVSGMKDLPRHPVFMGFRPKADIG